MSVAVSGELGFAGLFGDGVCFGVCCVCCVCVFVFFMFVVGGGVWWGPSGCGGRSVCVCTVFVFVGV